MEGDVARHDNAIEERVSKDTTAPGITHTTGHIRYFGQVTLVPKDCG